MSGSVPSVGGGVNSGLRSVGLRRICQGVWWMTRWWWPHRRARLSRLVSPPVAQWVMWWAWHIRGGLRQLGKVQCRSRRISAVQMVAVTRRRRRPMSRTSPWVPRTAGMISASQASRRRVSGGRSVPSAVVPTPVPVLARSFLRVWWSRVTRSRAGVPWVSGGRCGVQGVVGGGDQGVPEPGAVVAAVDVVFPGPRGSRVGSTLGSGQVSGSSAAIRRAPSSADPWPRSRTPPARSGLIER